MNELFELIEKLKEERSISSGTQDVFKKFIGKEYEANLSFISASRTLGSVEFACVLVCSSVPRRSSLALVRVHEILAQAGLRRLLLVCVLGGRCAIRQVDEKAHTSSKLSAPGAWMNPADAAAVVTSAPAPAPEEEEADKEVEIQISLRFWRHAGLSSVPKTIA